MSRRMTPRSSRACARRAPSSLARPISTSLRSARPTRTRRSALVRHPLDPEPLARRLFRRVGRRVLDGMAYASIGTDTGGSVRIPSAACGLVGLKPSLGEIPLDGRRAAEHDDGPCRTAVPLGRRRRTRAATRSAAGVRRIAPRRRRASRAFASACCAATSRRCSTRRWPRRSKPPAAHCQRGRGLSSKRSQIPHAGDIAPIYLHIVLAEAAAVHAKTLEATPSDYTPNVRIRLEMGRYILAEDYVRALRGRDAADRRGRCGAARPRCAAAAVARRCRQSGWARPRS